MPVHLQELDCSEQQWLEVCGQIDKLDKFFPLGAVALTRARDAQTAAIARGAACLLTLLHYSAVAIGSKPVLMFCSTAGHRCGRGKGRRVSHGSICFVVVVGG